MTSLRPDRPRKCSTAHSIRLALGSYLPPGVAKRLNGVPTNFKPLERVNVEEFLKPIFSKSIGDMRRYGSPRELADLLEEHCNFTGAHHLLGVDVFEPFDISLPTFKSFTGETYANKQDLFGLLQDVITVGYPLYNDITRTFLSAYLKHHEKTLTASCDFVQSAERILEVIERRIEIETRDLRYPARGSFTDKYDNYQQVINKIRTMIRDSSDEKHSSITDIIFDIFPTESKEDANYGYQCLIFNIETLIKVTDNILGVLPIVFKPISSMPDYPHPVLLRLFEDGQKAYVMREELDRNLFTPRFIRTIDAKDAFRSIASRPDQSVQVELLITPIPRSNHCAQPIRSPGEGHCKLAVDLFFELLRDLIFGIKVFQKMKSSEWNLIIEFFDKIKDVFNSEEKDIYFIRLSPENRYEQWKDQVFSEFINRETKNHRKAKPNGFTAQNIKNELIHLGLEEPFPEITNYAEVVYEHVSREKKTPVLRTCDLFDAVEHCQMIAFFKKMPQLAKFLHNQNGCHRVLITDCCGSKKPVKVPRFGWTELNSIPLTDVKVTDDGLICPKQNLELVTNSTANFAFLETCFPNGLEENTINRDLLISDRTFFIDKGELEDRLPSSALIKHINIHLILDISKTLKSLRAFSKLKRRRKLYLRTFSWSPISRESNRQVFAEEVKEMIPILLEYQGDAVDQKKIDIYWKENFGGSPMMCKEALIRALEEFDINKGMITLVPDIEYASSALYKMPLAKGYQSIVISGPTGESLVHKHQAIFRIFQEVVCDVDWTVRSDEIKRFREKILESMGVFLKSPEESLVPLEVIDEVISELKRHEYYSKAQKAMRLTPLITFYDCDTTDTINFDFFLFECEKYRLPYHFHPLSDRERFRKVEMPVWKARLLFLLEWSKMFFGEDVEELRRIATTWIMFRAPHAEWECQGDIGILIYVDKEPMVTAWSHVATSPCVLEQNLSHPWLCHTTERPFIRRGGREDTSWTGYFRAMMKALPFGREREVTSMDVLWDISSSSATSMFDVDKEVPLMRRIPLIEVD